MVNIKVFKRSISLSAELTAIALSRRAVFRNRFQDELNDHPKHFSQVSNFSISEYAMRRMIAKYSEQAVYRPIDDMRYFFQGARRLFSEPGYPPLFYPIILDRKMGQSISAVSAIGEGVAGLVAQRIYDCRKLSRPFRDGVDIVMSAENVTYLIEAKGTAIQSEKIEKWLDEKLGDTFLEEVSKEVLSSRGVDVRSVRGLLVGVHILSEINYHAYVIEIDIQPTSQNFE